MAALWNRAGHYIFALWFRSIFYLLFFSSPNLSGRRLNVYHTSTHGVALVRIENAGLKCAVRGSLTVQDAKNRHFGTIAQLCRAVSSQVRHVSTIGKKLVKRRYLLHMSSQYGELRPTNGWDPLASLGHPCKFQWVSRLGSVTVRHSSSGLQPNFATLNRGRHLYSAGWPSRWALTHIRVCNVAIRNWLWWHSEDTIMDGAAATCLRYIGLPNVSTNPSKTSAYQSSHCTRVVSC